MLFPTRLLQGDAEFGPLFGWGNSNGGQLGVAGTANFTVPTQLDAYRRWRKASITGHMGIAHAIRADGTLWAAGLKANIGIGGGSGQTTGFVQVGTDTGWTDVAAGSERAAGIRNGSLYVWGDEVSLTPKKVGSNSDWDKVAAGSEWVYGIRGGRLYFIPEYDGSPIQIGAATDWVHVSAANGLTDMGVVAIREGGLLYSGTGEGEDTPPTMAQVGSDTGWTDAACNGDGAFAGIRDGMLYTWGSNSQYQTGLGTNSGSTATPTLASDLSGWTKVSMGKTNFGAGLRRSRLYTWGRNQACQTGLGTSSGYAMVPTQVGPYGGWLDVSCGSFAAMGIRA